MEIKDMTLDNNKITISFNSKEKEYLYDSLCYRYIRAREHMADYECLREQQSNPNSSLTWKAYRLYRERANRDISRFCEILNEAIGEHT